MNGWFAEKLRLTDFRVTPYQMEKDDYTFELGGVTYYTDAAVGRNKKFLTIVALDELKEANKKIAALEKRVAELTIKKIYSELQTA